MKVRSIGSYLAFSFFFLSVSLLLVRPASAITISPVLFDESMDPGQAKQGTINVLNETNQTQTYYASVQNFVGKGEDGQQEFIAEKDATDLAQWIKLEKSEVALEPGRSADFKYVIDIPKSAEPGGHYAAVFLSTQPNGTANSSVGIGGRTGVLFLVKVSGAIRESVDVESFELMGSGSEDAERAEWISYLPAYFEARIKNNGTVHEQPQGEMVVRNMFGNKVGVVKANAAGGRVLPGGVRRYRMNWGGHDGNIQEGFVCDLMKEWDGFAFGLYSAELTATYGASHQQLKAGLSFWVIPWRSLLVGLVSLIVLFVLLKLYNRMIINSAAKKNRK